jgi:predicted nucleic acid-binding protein
MPAVSNTSPILGLAAIGCLDLLRRQFGQIEISPVVLAELKTETDFRGAADIASALQEGWILQIEVQDRDLVQALSLDLDAGEAEAIALSLQRGYTQVLMDETDGRARVKALGLKPVGVLGVLLRAKQVKEIDSVRQAMLALRQEIGFFIADELFAEILAQSGEE